MQTPGKPAGLLVTHNEGELFVVPQETSVWSNPSQADRSLSRPGEFSNALDRVGRAGRGEARHPRVVELVAEAREWAGRGPAKGAKECRKGEEKRRAKEHRAKKEGPHRSGARSAFINGANGEYTGTDDLAFWRPFCTIMLSYFATLALFEAASAGFGSSANMVWGCMCDHRHQSTEEASRICFKGHTRECALSIAAYINGGVCPPRGNDTVYVQFPIKLPQDMNPTERSAYIQNLRTCVAQRWGGVLEYVWRRWIEKRYEIVVGNTATAQPTDWWTSFLGMRRFAGELPKIVGQAASPRAAGAFTGRVLKAVKGYLDEFTGALLLVMGGVEPNPGYRGDDNQDDPADEQLSDLSSQRRGELEAMGVLVTVCLHADSKMKPCDVDRFTMKRGAKRGQVVYQCRECKGNVYKQGDDLYHPPPSGVMPMTLDAKAPATHLQKAGAAPVRAGPNPPLIIGMMRVQGTMGAEGHVSAPAPGGAPPGVAAAPPREPVVGAAVAPEPSAPPMPTEPAVPERTPEQGGPPRRPGSPSPPPSSPEGGGGGGPPPSSGTGDLAVRPPERVLRGLVLADKELVAALGLVSTFARFAPSWAFMVSQVVTRRHFDIDRRLLVDSNVKLAEYDYEAVTVIGRLNPLVPYCGCLLGIASAAVAIAFSDVLTIACLVLGSSALVMPTSTLAIPYIPHLVTTVLVDCARTGSENITTTSIRSRLRRVASFPLTDEDAAQVLEGSELMCLAVLKTRNYFHQGPAAAEAGPPGLCVGTTTVLVTLLTCSVLVVMYLLRELASARSLSTSPDLGW